MHALHIHYQGCTFPSPPLGILPFFPTLTHLYFLQNGYLKLVNCTLYKVITAKL